MFHHSHIQRGRFIGLVLIVMSLMGWLMTLRPNLVEAQGLGPNITVMSKGLTIAHGDTTPSLVDGTDFGTDVMPHVDSPALLYNEFFIRNTGDKILNITSVTAPAGFIVWAMHRPILPGEEIMQTLDCNDGVGLVSGPLTITSDDPDTPTYTFTIRCEHRAVFDLVVLGNNFPIMNGDTTPENLDGTHLSSVSTYGQAIYLSSSFQVKNNGTSLNTQLDISTTSSHTSVEWQAWGGGHMAGGQWSHWIGVTCKPKTYGTFEAVIRIKTKYRDIRTGQEILHTLHTFTVKCPSPLTPPPPDIEIQGNGLNIALNDTTPNTADGTFFSKPATGQVTHSFTIFNRGAGSLTVTGYAAQGFRITVAPVVDPQSQAIFTIECLAAPSSGNIVLSSNVPDEPAYTFAVRCLGSVPVPTPTAAPTSTRIPTLIPTMVPTIVPTPMPLPPDIDIQSNSVTIAHNDTAADAADGTFFDSPGAHSFTISNIGQRVLTVTAQAPQGFRITLPPIVSPQSQAVFVIECLVAPSNGSIVLNSNDPDEPVYTFAVQCLQPTPAQPQAPTPQAPAQELPKDAGGSPDIVVPTEGVPLEEPQTSAEPAAMPAPQEATPVGS